MLVRFQFVPLGSIRLALRTNGDGTDRSRRTALSGVGSFASHMKISREKTFVVLLALICSACGPRRERIHIRGERACMHPVICERRSGTPLMMWTVGLTIMVQVDR